MATKRKPKQVLPSQAITKSTTFRANPYIGETDPAQFIHSNKTHRSASEAFRDAQYACAITTFKTDWMLTIDFLEQAFLGALWTLCAVGGVGAFIYWLLK